MFGDHGRCGAFPTSSPAVKRQQSITVQDTPAIVRLNEWRPPGYHGPRTGKQQVQAARSQYMCFDEAYFKTLESMQWNRDNGFVELIPIILGLPQ
jgi:hypothetical protein